MSVISKQGDHLLVKRPTSIETAVPNTTYLERRIENRITIGTIKPNNPLLGDIHKWVNTPSGRPVQLQCVSTGPGDPVWDNLIEPTASFLEYEGLLERIAALEALLSTAGLFYENPDLDALLALKASITHDHASFWSPISSYLDYVEATIAAWEDLFVQLALYTA